MPASGASSAAALAINEITKSSKTVFAVTGSASTDFTGKACSSTTFQFTFDTYALANGTAKAILKQGGDTWFFLTVDYAVGHSMQRDVTRFVEQAGGKVLGSVKHPLNNSDFSSYLLQAQASKAKVIGLANAGPDAMNALKQGSEFGITQGGQTFAGLIVFISEVNTVGLEVAQGLVLTTSFYWDIDDKTRLISERFALRACLKQDARASRQRRIQQGRRGSPGWSRSSRYVSGEGEGTCRVQKPNDYYQILAKIPGNEAFRPRSQSECPLVTKN